MHITFQGDAWDETALTHAYTYRFPHTNRFVRYDDHIENGENPAMDDGFDYLSLMTREACPGGTTVTARCSFSGMGAPLLVISEDLVLCEDGCFRYGNYYEVVLYRNGLNVWRLWRQEDGIVTWHKRLGAEFPVTEQEIHTLSVRVDESYLSIDVDGMGFQLRAEDLFPTFYAGITGCEGICRFYDLRVESARDARS